MKIVRIYPKSGFHTYLHSDTLWGNILYAYKLIYGENALISLLDSYMNNIFPFVVSSVFPFEFNDNKNDRYIYYFPKPILDSGIINIESSEDMSLLKEFKSIKFIERKIFEEYLNGTVNDKELFKRYKIYKKEEEKDSSQRNQKMIEENSFRFIRNLQISYNLHNSIDRISGSTLEAEGRGQLYWEGEYTFFKSNFGLFFLIEGSKLNEVEACLRLLSHIGIGGNRSIGKGSFSYQIDEFNLNIPNETNGYILLSLYHPRKEELELLSNDKTKFFYDLTIRIGYVGKDFDNTPQEKNPVQCFTEGSTFFLSQKPYGCILPTAKTKNQSDIFSNYLFFGLRGKLRLV